MGRNRWSRSTLPSSRRRIPADQLSHNGASASRRNVGLFPMAALLVGLICCTDARLIETELLVVIGMGQLVKHYPGLLADVSLARGPAGHLPITLALALLAPAFKHASTSPELTSICLQGVAWRT